MLWLFVIYGNKNHRYLQKNIENCFFQTMETQQVKITLPDGNHTAISIYSPEISGKNNPVLIIYPAMGVKGSYYRPLAESLIGKGCIVIITDLRGHGASSLRPSRKTDFGYESMDYPGL